MLHTEIQRTSLDFNVPNYAS